MRTHAWAWGCWILAGVLLSGCSGRDASETIPVEGSVLLDGKPLEDATVAFIPKASGHPAAGKTNAQGKFTLSTFAVNDGAIPGQHTVLISKSSITAKGGPKRDATPAGLSPVDGSAQRVAIKYLVPQRYSDPTKSGLSADVKRGMAPLSFDLQSK